MVFGFREVSVEQIGEVGKGNPSREIWVSLKKLRIMI
jgi:hypothetical protein